MADEKRDDTGDTTGDPADIGRTEERPLRTEIPPAPGKDLGPHGTRDTDEPPNTRDVPPSNDLSEDPVTPEPPG